MAAKLWPDVQRRPWLALAAFLGYELLLAAVGFAGKVFGDLQDRWAKAAADGVDAVLRRTSARFERAYRDQVRGAVRFVDQKGLATRSDRTPELAKIYVDVSLEPRVPHETARAPLAGRAEMYVERRSLWSFLGGEAPVVLAVIGPPGTGKTTLLRHVALSLGRERARRRDLPVLLYLRDHAAAIDADPAIGLPALIASRLDRLRGQEPSGWFDRQLAAGRCTVMLDGLDEVAREQDRENVVDWVERQIAQYPANDFIITSRPHGYHAYPLNSATTLQVRRFTGEQIAEFVRGWYLAEERLATGGEPDADVELLAARQAGALLEKLRESPQLYDLAANPLLLTMIANVHRHRGALPGSRAELYAEICQVLLWRRAEAKGRAAQQETLRGDRKEQVLRELAFTMMERNVRDLPEAEAAAVVGPALRRVAGDAVQPQDFLADVRNGGLLHEHEAGLYAFSHQTFQEYLAAAYIHDHPRIQQILIAAVDDPWWRETTLLYAARADCTAIVDACLALGNVPALALAFDCAEEGRSISPATRQELDKLLLSSLDADSPHSLRTRLFNAIAVTRHLRDAVRLGDYTWVCTRPITPSIYRLFLASPASRVRPWTSRHPGDVTAALWPDDVAGFVAWVNDVVSDDRVYRLPTRDEVEDPAFRLVLDTGTRGVWYAEKGAESAHERLPAPRVPPGAPDPFRATRDVILDQVVADWRDLTVASAAFVVIHLALDHAGPGRRPGRNKSAEQGTPVADRAESVLREYLHLVHESFHLDMDTALALTLDRPLSSTRKLNLTLDHALSRALQEGQKPTPFVRHRHPIDRAVSRVRKHCLLRSMAILLGLQPTAPWPGRRARDTSLAVLLEWLMGPCFARMPSSPGPATFAALVAVLGETSEAVRSICASNQEDRRLRHVQELATGLMAIGESVLDGREPFGADFAACVRLGALALASRLDRLPGGGDVAKRYREIASAVTAMQRRAEGEPPVNEAIVLVRT
ncbi:NACHT domain-containing protein [Sphaerisporangium krabiense]|uniref:DNA polymerase III delta prime subunit n=1 Tax=Sphaerisporangium krabiense TaxID=763782 RepID=A0A7W8Z4L8_9ACTN|nr:NACHT domain-containing protein [Sphaerisporangium krabiense]MBB5627311.1 DNA polymerase III delta prime subunit [Sphaerisporangium krabiense]